MKPECSNLELKIESAESSLDKIEKNHTTPNSRTELPQSSVFSKSDDELSQYEDSMSIDRKVGMRAIRYLWRKSGAAKIYSSVFGPCPMEPHCSHYGYEAIAEHGLIKGAMYGFRRTLRCNPLGWKGQPIVEGRVYDPIPKKDNSEQDDFLT